jgi:hypothetical protein
MARFFVCLLVFVEKLLWITKEGGHKILLEGIPLVLSLLKKEIITCKTK